MSRRGVRWTPEELERVTRDTSAKPARKRRSDPVPSATDWLRSASEIEDPAVPMIYQPNNYTCGPSCIAMVSAACHPGVAHLDVGELATAAGTNTKTGTTHVEMANGLNAAGLRWVRGGARTADDLRRTIREPSLVLLRTLVEGCKHWVVVDGLNGQDFRIACPSDGPKVWSEAYLMQAWSARDFDHFVVPRSSFHYGPIRPMHQMTLRAFTFPGRVIRDSEFGGGERSAIDQVATFLAEAPIDPLHELPYTRPGYRFFRCVGDTGRQLGRGAFPLLALPASGVGRPIGGILAGTTFVDPGHRGNGLGSALVMAAHNDGPWRYLFPTHFSEGGYRARAGAHAIAVKEALAQGLEVSPEVIESNPRIHNQPLVVPFAVSEEKAAQRAATVSKPAFGTPEWKAQQQKEQEQMPF